MFYQVINVYTVEFWALLAKDGNDVMFHSAHRPTSKRVRVWQRIRRIWASIGWLVGAVPGLSGGWPPSQQLMPGSILLGKTTWDHFRMTEIFEFLIVSEKKREWLLKSLKTQFKQKIHGLSKKRIYDLYKIWTWLNQHGGAIGDTLQSSTWLGTSSFYGQALRYLEASLPRKTLRLYHL